MGSLSRVVGFLIGVVLLVGAGTAWAGDGEKGPDVSGTAVAAISSSSALLTGSVDPNKHSTTYVFEYGPTTAYGAQTPTASAGSSDSAKPVSAPLTGLQPSTSYHFRLVATSSKGTTRGPDRSFITLAGDPGPGAGPGATPGSGEGQAGPELGKSVLVAPTQGDLLVRRRGSSSYEPLELGSELPLGSEIDARSGSLALTSALPSGATQTGQFGGGRFVIRQSKRGYVDLFLRGRYCPSAHGSTVATAAGNSGRRLWGRDHGGRFRTHGRNSHATVRGTRWLVADSCAGTLTRVTRGSVVVRDTVRDKRIVLEPGERYLARPRH